MKGKDEGFFKYHIHKELNLVLCDDLEGWDEGWEADSRQWGYMYTYS